MSLASTRAVRAGMLAIIVAVPLSAAGQTATAPPAAPPLPPTQIPSAAARDPQDGRRVDAPGETAPGKPAPATDPPNSAAR